MTISHRKRLETTLSGEKPDRTPIALWHHFPVDDQNPDRLAAATIAFQEQFDFDLIKVMPSSSFCLKDWGVEDEWRGNEEGTRDYVKRVIRHPEDWAQLQPLDPNKGYLGKQLQCLAYLQEAFTDKTPYIQTIFNPLSQVKNLVGPKNLPVHLRQYPDALHEGLKAIQETTIRFIEAARQSGISGIFFAVQHATYEILTEDEYLEFGKAYDLPILQATDDLWVNMVHLHGDQIMFDMFADYPVQIMNWHDRETPPSLSEGLELFPGTVCGGISRIESFALGTPGIIKQEAREAYQQTGGKRLILGTGCVLPLTTPYGNVMAARQIAQELT
jgi:uroporphyrinogen decarboxylase